jgi:arylsulfatase A-like enzyme
VTRGLLLVVIAVVVGCGESTTPFPASTVAPDVILVTLDTTRADHLGVYGYPRDISPSIDRFAANSVTFSRAWASGAWTLPTHASILTGKHSSRHGARFDVSASDVSLSAVLEGDFFAKHKARRLPEAEVTLAELLSERGYTTAAFTGGPWLAAPFGLMQGYEVADAAVTGVVGRSAAELTDRMIEWMATVPRDRPLHALINYFDPHSPYEPPPGYDDLPGAKVVLDPNQNEIFVNGGRVLDESQRLAIVDRYDGEIRFMDHHLGRLMDALRDAGRYDDSLIIVVGDHGELIGEHGLLGHGRWLYEPVVRVPLLVHYPGGRNAGSVETAMVSQVDLLAMIVSELGFTLTGEVDSVPIGMREHVLAEAFRDPFSVNTYGDRYDRDLVAVLRWPGKLIKSDTGVREVYDLSRDPNETDAAAGAAISDDLERALAQALDALGPRRETTPPSDVSPQVQQNLRELGYID